MLSSWLYVIGCFALLPGTILLLSQFADFYRSGISWLVVACSFLTLAALLDFVHFLGARSKVGHETQLVAEEGDYSHEFSRDPILRVPCYEGILNPLCSLLGGILFLMGALMFWPSIAEDSLIGTTVANVGTWVFRVGSCCYMLGSFNFVRQWCQQKNKDYWAISGALSFIAGSLMYLTGGILNQLDKPDGPQLWVGGSVAFAVGSICYLYSAGPCSSCRD